MGGGDLNTKKSWHPNTMKNQERVWKAEQAAAEEKKRIVELQREREEERDRSQLKEMAQRNFGANSSAAGDNRLHWMYDKPDKQAQQEDYLLGKAIGKNDGNEAQQNTIPALSRRVVGSSMNTTGDDTQVDLARKMREDPLLLVKERERAARAALLNNPLQRKKLAELLRKEQEQKLNKDKSKKKSKKEKKGKNLDDVLAAKLNALAGNKGIDLNSLLNSDDSSNSSSEDDNESRQKKKKKKLKRKKSKSNAKSSESDSESSKDDLKKAKQKSSKSHRDNKTDTRKRKSESSETSDDESPRKKRKQESKRKFTETESRNFKKDQSTEENGRYYKDKYHGNKVDVTDRRDRYNKESPRRQDKNASTSSRGNQRDDSPSRGRFKRGETPPIKRDERYSPSKSKKYRDDSPLKRRDRRNESPPRRKDRRDDPSPRRRDHIDDSPPKRDYRKSPPRKSYNDRRNKSGLSEEEKAARLAEMVAAGAEREVERGTRVARQRAEDAAAAEKASFAPRQEACALPDSLESRIRSNRHYIQRDKLHMNEHFARR